MTTRRTYTNRERAKAVGIAVVTGVSEAERQTGIPKETIHYWTDKPEFAHLRTRARELVADDMWTGVQIGLRAVIEGLQNPDAPLRDKAQALGIVYDRFALLSGEATTRSEHRDITDVDADGVAAIEGLLAGSPWEVTAGVEHRRNGASTNGKH